MPQTHAPGHFKSGPALKVRRNRALGWGGQRGYRKNAGWENRQKGIAHLAGPTPARRFLRTRCRVLKPRGPLPRKPADTFLDTFLVGQKSIDHRLLSGSWMFLGRGTENGSAGKASNPPCPYGAPPLHKGGFGGQRLTASQAAFPPHPSCPCGAIHLPLKGKAFTPLVFAKQRSFAAPTARRKAGFFAACGPPK